MVLCVSILIYFEEKGKPYLNFNVCLWYKTSFLALSSRFHGSILPEIRTQCKRWRVLSAYVKNLKMTEVEMDGYLWNITACDVLVEDDLPKPTFKLLLFFFSQKCIRKGRPSSSFSQVSVFMCRIWVLKRESCRNLNWTSCLGTSQVLWIAVWCVHVH